MTGLFQMSTIVTRFLRAFSSPQQQRIRSLRDDDFLLRAQTVIHRHLADPLFSTSTAAEELAMSRMHLNRRLRVLTGKSTHEFIRAIRLGKAQEMILHSSAPITAVSSAVGFKSPSQFARAFREWCGMTPSRYRALQPPRVTPDAQSRMD